MHADLRANSWSHRAVTVIGFHFYTDLLRFWAEVVGEETEHIYGGGEQYTYLDLKGRRYPIWVREQGVGRNRHVVDV